MWPGMDFDEWIQNDWESDDWIEKHPEPLPYGACAGIIGGVIIAVILGSCVACI